MGGWRAIRYAAAAHASTDRRDWQVWLKVGVGGGECGGAWCLVPHRAWLRSGRRWCEGPGAKESWDSPSERPRTAVGCSIDCCGLTGMLIDYVRVYERDRKREMHEIEYTDVTIRPIGVMMLSALSFGFVLLVSWSIGLFCFKTPSDTDEEHSAAHEEPHAIPDGATFEMVLQSSPEPSPMPKLRV